MLLMADSLSFNKSVTFTFQHFLYFYVSLSLLLPLPTTLICSLIHSLTHQYPKRQEEKDKTDNTPLPLKKKKKETF